MVVCIFFMSTLNYALHYTGAPVPAPGTPRHNQMMHFTVPLEVVRNMSPYRLLHVRDWYLHGCTSPWHPLPPTDAELQSLWSFHPFTNRPVINYDAVLDTFYDLVHPGYDEVVNGVTHSFLNLAILPDWLLNDDLALETLDLK